MGGRYVFPILQTYFNILYEYLPFGYGNVLELVSIYKSLNNLEGMIIFGSNDTNMEGMTIIQKE